ncbi:MAG: EAL domain-containing protein, partial [Rhodospirillales bacterium]|nr:EAL domain-containing protein [Rhodospirillales bacterium]MCW8953047.1 EAL domain-containing protein [Rhodospirillales bacterium]MCW8971296.1 EAL domain-containing protein [Rhodospirillales bacterium]
EAGRRFKEEGLRHFLVVDRADDIVGIVSQTDIVLSAGVEHYMLLRDVASVLNSNTLLISGGASLSEAVERMRAAKADAAIVVDEGGNPEGIVTQRDLVRMIAARKFDAILKDIAGKPLLMVSRNTSLLRARKILEKERKRHLGVQDEDGKLIGLLSFSEILSSIEYQYVARLKVALDERDRALELSSKNLELAQRVIDSSFDGVMISDADGKIISVNPAFSRVTGYRSDEVIGKTPGVLSSGRHGKEFYDAMWAQLQEKGYWQGEIWNRRKNGEVYPEWLSINAIEDEKGEIRKYAAIFTDITERKRSEEKIRNLAYYDALTGLPNRRLFNDRLSMAIANAHRHEHSLAVMFIDLDLFKRINDTLGHGIGDEVLQEVARRLEGCMREGDTISRMGGDEFIILQNEIEGEEDAVRLARRAVKLLGEPINIGKHNLSVTSSIGISIYPEDGTTLEALIKNADTAMYRAKDLGRNSFQLYTNSMNVRSFERLTMESNLRSALDKGEFFLNYQVKTNLEEGGVTGVEALVRWRNEEHGIVPPAEFIPMAEELGLISELGEWVLREACRQNRVWQEKGLPKVRISINVSPQQFRKGNFVDTVKFALNDSGLAPEFLELELTESLLLENVEMVIETLNVFRNMGIRISIDDFGTGYSNFGYLKKIPIDTIKIDGSFVRNLASNRDDAEIISAMIAMARNLNLRVVAEGVETEDQMAFLRANSCDEIQGYLVSRPVSGDNLESLFERNLLPDTPGIELPRNDV